MQGLSFSLNGNRLVLARWRAFWPPFHERVGVSRNSDEAALNERGAAAGVLDLATIAPITSHVFFLAGFVPQAA
jgi:hypothetical protein